MKLESVKFNPYEARGGEMFIAVRRLFLGRNLPGPYTRVVCNLGILYFIYSFFWSGLVLLVMNFGHSMPHYTEWNEWFTYFGNYYGIVDIQQMFNMYVVAVMGVSIFLLAGIILAWRGRTSGFMLGVIAELLLVILPFLILGESYYRHEVKMYEWVISLVMALLFLSGYILRKKGKLRY